MANNIMISFPRKTSSVIINHVQRRYMPVNVPPTATGKRRFRLAVETDPHKLVNYCCGLNYHIDESPIKLKPDNEYPDWLWKLRLTPKPKSWEMEKGTKEYYYTLAKEGKQRNFLLRLKGERDSKVVGKVLKSQQEYLHRLRFAALASMEDDAGLDTRSLEVDWLSEEHGYLNVRDYYLPVNENKVIYKDKIPGNTHLKNYYYDYESTMGFKPKNVMPKPPRETKATQDSKRRYQHSVA